MISSAHPTKSTGRGTFQPRRMVMRQQPNEDNAVLSTEVAQQQGLDALTTQIINHWPLSVYSTSTSSQLLSFPFFRIHQHHSVFHTSAVDAMLLNNQGIKDLVKYIRVWTTKIFGFHVEAFIYKK
jgi:hypothetical protein